MNYYKNRDFLFCNKYTLPNRIKSSLGFFNLSHVRLHAALQKEILNFSGLYRGQGVIDSPVKLWVFGLHDKNNLTFTGKSICTPSPILSISLCHPLGKWHLIKSCFSRRMYPLSLLFRPLSLNKKLKYVWLKAMTVGNWDFDFNCSKIPMWRPSLASAISCCVSLGLLNDLRARKKHSS